ncbi:hypothetical protein [Streptomyces sp. NPDC048357]|uniref:hypothetical protein n=1 Tax=Streptomyces sp. NPDC048357 TaxID=3154719 RepID=UPI003444A9F0
MAIDNASRVPVTGARLTLQIWEDGLVHRLPEMQVPTPTFTFEVPDKAQSVVCELRHDRYAPLNMALVRAQGESVWRWTNSTRRVSTRGRDVLVSATLGRIRPMPVSHIRNEDLRRRAEVHRSTLEAFRRHNEQRLTPRRPNFVPFDFGQRTALVTADHTKYNRQEFRPNPRVDDFHVAKPELFSNVPSALGWERFATAPRSVEPVSEGRLYMVEYGEVGADPSPGPRFSVGVWVPHVLHSPKVEKLDFVVWLHPAVTNNELRFPQVQFPYRDPYPYGLVATLVDGNPRVDQQFVDIPIAHLLDQHLLAYQLAAARKAAVLVLPVAPSNHFEAFTRPALLMRLLRELCLWIPQDFPRGAEAVVHRPPPEVGRIAVSAFSSSVPELRPLMEGRVLELDYPAPFWYSSRNDQGLDDATDFRRAWKEQWAIDSLGRGFQEYTDAAASWVQDDDDRRLRIYKSAYTGGWNLPTPQRGGAWADMVKKLRLTLETHTSGTVKAVSLRDTRSRIHAVSVPNEFMLGPESGREAALKPELRADGAHEMMPRVFFGHAVASSKLTDIS